MVTYFLLYLYILEQGKYEESYKLIDSRLKALYIMENKKEKMINKSINLYKKLYKLTPNNNIKS